MPPIVSPRFSRKRLIANKLRNNAISCSPARIRTSCDCGNLLTEVSKCLREFALREGNAVSLRPRADIVDRLRQVALGSHRTFTGWVHEVPGRERSQVTHLTANILSSAIKLHLVVSSSTAIRFTTAPSRRFSSVQQRCGKSIRYIVAHMHNTGLRKWIS